MKTLLIDNYDSYTYNLYQALARISGTSPVVVTNDDPAWRPDDVLGFDAVVISPGPGRPDDRRDFGCSRDALLQTAVPVLGVCLGHQGIGDLAGASVMTAPFPRHGHVERISHSGDALFAGMPRQFAGVRYHSLCLAEPLPPDLDVTARSQDGVVMAIRHRTLPQWGVQFHPESVSTDYGPRLLRNFQGLAGRHGRDGGAISVNGGSVRPALVVGPSQADVQPLDVHVVTMDYAVDAEETYLRLFADEPHNFWLDSSKIVPGLSRFSFVGACSGPRAEILTYRVGRGSVDIAKPNGHQDTEPGTIFDVLKRRLSALRITDDPDLPFGFRGGYVGYFGYELKADLGARQRHVAATADAIWIYNDRFVAIDHDGCRTYVVALSAVEDAEESQRWVAATVEALRSTPAATGGTGQPASGSSCEDVAPIDVEPLLSRPRAVYLRDIAECHRLLAAGQTYEVCLTNTVRIGAPANDVAYYLRLRQRNPAPYSAFLKLDDVVVMCSSPERFLHLDQDGVIESRPIKGTAPRSADPVADEMSRRSLVTSTKSQAENRMIVDLMRNDLGKVSEIGSVRVPRFLTTESYATVHQLISSVTARLRPGLDAIDAVRACFPGGSMTGAPKLRTMEIIDQLETEARGIYSGSLGYLSLNNTMDLNIVIRTGVRIRDELVIGAGGAIVLDSDPDSEYDEMVLKAQAPLRGFGNPVAIGVSQQGEHSDH
jgi:para-aminobenzoate synthetase